MTLRDIRDFLESGMVRALAWAIPLLPRKGCVRLANILGQLAFLVDGRGRRVALANLQAVFQNRFSPAERNQIARASYQNLARTFLDLFWTPRLLSNNQQHWIRYEDPHGSLELPSCILISLHAGGFEWSGIGRGLQDHPIYFLAQDFKNLRTGEIFNRLREMTGNTGVNRRGGMLKLLNKIREGRSVVTLTDLTLDPRMPSAAVSAGGLWMCGTIIHAVLHLRTGAPIVPGTVEVHPDGSTVVRLYPPLPIPPGADEQIVAQICWDFFWPHIEAAPGRWMWNYKHWRFKPAGDAADYPFYANESARFTKRLAQGKARRNSAPAEESNPGSPSADRQAPQRRSELT